MPSKHMTQHKSYKSQLRTSEVPLIQFGGKKWGDELLVTKHGHWKMIFRWRFLVILEDFLVGGLEHFFPYIGNTVIIPTDFYIFQTGRYTTNQVALDNLRGIEEMHPCSVHLSDLPMRVAQNFFQPMKGYGHTGSWNRTRKCLTFGLRIGVWCTWALQLLLPSLLCWFCMILSWSLFL